ncbi:MAG: SRPBCC family protein [Gemmatimonadales bacterium]
MPTDDLLAVLAAYPQIYHACHRRHVRSRGNPDRLSSRDSWILGHLHQTRPVSPSRLAHHMGLGAPTVSEAVQRLERLGYLVRRRAPPTMGRRRMTWLLALLGAVVLLGLGVWVVGTMLPSGHVARMAIDLPVAPDTVWARIADVEGTPAWRSDVRSVEALPAVDGRARFVEVTGHGRTPYEVLAQEPPARQQVRVVDDGLPFGGTWTWELTPQGGGTRLQITEDGFVRSPLFRVMGRLFFPPTATMRTYLGDLSTALGATAQPEVIRPR